MIGDLTTSLIVEIGSTRWVSIVCIFKAAYVCSWSFTLDRVLAHQLAVCFVVILADARSSGAVFRSMELNYGRASKSDPKAGALMRNVMLLRCDDLQAGVDLTPAHKLS